MPESVLMAKKRQTDKPGPGAHRLEVISFRCSSQYKEHLEQIAEQETRTPTQVMQRALEAYAKSGGYEPFPKR